MVLGFSLEAAGWASALQAGVSAAAELFPCAAYCDLAQTFS